ncbi:phage tailspike protein [Escherichia coli]|uniref:phage tailspike protein n=1 Tax=Escherichia coli TaxID=562 RepID=UPI00197CB7D7|nr:phage tailspike protein [Escherichia coli]MBN4780430.1 hypothetical protein [Escherichia coli]HCE0473554.1 hypothetical protein [Escherichia coli]
MTDITANVIVSMPSQLFTMARSFKAVANGKIYIGKIDTDPVNPENQIQVYIENEDGSHAPVSQPIIINTAGYPVYNGQIAKFVTVQGHSMAVYDAYGTQQFYYPNVLKYDPDQLRQELGGYDGAKVIGECPDIETLRTIEPQENSQRIIVRHHTLNSGYGGGQFRSRLDGSSYTDNNGTVIKTTGGAVWLRINADVITPLMFGAIPDGVTDCSAAFQSAVRSGPVVVPKGEFVIQDVAMDIDGASLVGCGDDSKLIVPPGSTGIIFGSQSAYDNNPYLQYDDIPHGGVAGQGWKEYVSGLSLRNLHIVSSSRTDGSTGIRTVGVTDSIISNIACTKLHYFVKVTQIMGCKIEKMHCSNLNDSTTDCGFFIYGPAIGNVSDDNVVRDCLIRTAFTSIRLEGTGAEFARIDGWLIQGCTFFPQSAEGAQAGADFIYASNTIHWQIVDNRFYTVGRNNIRIDSSCRKMQISNNQFVQGGRFTTGGAASILIQTQSGSAFGAFGELVISDNIFDFPSGEAIHIIGMSGISISGNIILNPNEQSSWGLGTWSRKAHDAIRLAKCGYFNISNNKVTTGHNAQGTRHHEFDWRWDIFIEGNCDNGTVEHDSYNVQNNSSLVRVTLPSVEYTRGAVNAAIKESQSPYTTTGWSTVTGVASVAAVSGTNPYSSVNISTYLQFTFTYSGTACAMTRTERAPITGRGLTTTMMMRVNPSSVSSARVSLQLGDSTGVGTAQRTIFLNQNWVEVSLTKNSTGAGATSSFVTLIAEESCVIDVAEIRTVADKYSTPVSGYYTGTVQPVTGFWRQGDVVKNQGATPGSHKGWVCTATGIPGTWVSEGNL